MKQTTTAAHAAAPAPARGLLAAPESGVSATPLQRASDCLQQLRAAQTEQKNTIDKLTKLMRKDASGEEVDMSQTLDDAAAKTAALEALVRSLTESVEEVELRQELQELAIISGKADCAEKELRLGVAQGCASAASAQVVQLTAELAASRAAQASVQAAVGDVVAKTAAPQSGYVAREEEDGGSEQKLCYFTDMAADKEVKLRDELIASNRGNYGALFRELAKEEPQSGDLTKMALINALCVSDPSVKLPQQSHTQALHVLQSLAVLLQHLREPLLGQWKRAHPGQERTSDSLSDVPMPPELAMPGMNRRRVFAFKLVKGDYNRPAGAA